MTDAMSSEDIDRVLANIRRLVSVEEDARAGTGRLVLTSDLRVDEPAAAGAPEEAVEPEDVVSAEASRPEPADDRPRPSDEGGPRPRSLEERIADLQSAIGQDRPAACEAEGSEDQAQHLPKHVPSIQPVRPERRDAPMLLRPVLNEQTASDAHEDDGNLYDDPETTGAGIAELRFFHADDRFDRPGYTGRDDPLEPGEDEQFLDEDALRDLVAEIVREELAGALGERITRNVRKLVRREIMRALSTREFE